jgi:hypothetical protein
MPFTYRTVLSRGALVAALTACLAGGMASAGPALPRDIAATDTVSDGPRVALARNLVASAAAYEGYMRRAGEIRADFRDGPSVSKALTQGASYEPRQLEEGAIAYAALAALQNPTFVRSVRALNQDEQAALAGHLLTDPSAALALPGADQAGATAAGVLRAHGSQVLEAGKSVKQAAYDVQHQAWSKGAVPDASGRLARTKALSNARYTPGPDDTVRLMKTTVALREATGEARDGLPAPSPVVQRGLALAALAVMGRAGDADAESLTPLLSEPKSSFCLKMAKLNLFQCLAVARPYYEDVFCLGQHALIDTGKCVSDAAGAPESGRRAAIDIAAAGPDAGGGRSVMVPIAIAAR